MSVQEQIRQLNDARKLVLTDVKFYPDVVKGILPILQPNSLLELRRWGADFLAEAFATPALSVKDKETMQVSGVLDTLEMVLNNPNEDPHVLRSIILASASIYPVTLRWTIENSYDNISWQKMTAIKSRVLSIWDTASVSVRICCIKFAQRVVLAQTPVAGNEPKRGDSMDVSLDRIPPSHALLDPRTLEAEAHGLLDRILSILQDSNTNVLNEGLVVDATMNCLAILVRTRHNIANRIFGVVLNFDPYRHTNGMMTPKDKIVTRSMMKTVRIFLIGFMKRDPQNPFAQRIHQRIEWLMVRGPNGLPDDNGRKRPFEAQQQNHMDPKRQRMAHTAQIQPPQHEEVNYQTPPLGPGPHTLADLFTLSSSANDTVKGFDVHTLPPPLVSRIIISTLASIKPHVLERKIQDVRQRFDTLRAAVPPPPPTTTGMNPNTQPLGVEADDDDDYEPDYYMGEDDEQMLNTMDSEPTQAVVPKPEASLSLEAFKLPTAPPLTQESALGMGQLALRQVFEDRVTVSDDSASTSATAKKTKLGWRQFAANSGDRDSWITTLIRIASRSSSEVGQLAECEAQNSDADATASTEHDSDANADPESPVIKTEQSTEKFKKSPTGVVAMSTALNDGLRDMIYKYILGDFRKRVDVAVLWLCEEWYNDRVQARYGAATSGREPQYHRLVLRLLDGFLPYLNPGDKVLTRFLSEIPELSEAILTRVKNTCRDPTVVSLVLTSLLYLVMMRPPVKEIALDAIQGIWQDFEDARSLAGKYLTKFRPEWLAAATAEAEAKKNSEAVSAEPVAV
ncbi:hypothetical protein TD95_001084 [Thielaviopsis punctulata]|uniref:Symplekin/Pta1 N-terminal domain-containing protein n=1 Tax=Thielaviopsis punctulata TaxID=72032 RepID=A0A0F4ZK28_9PEZI|nr:hypothetical protein TD95_001084 [Thielaviopsis punctulata]